MKKYIAGICSLGILLSGCGTGRQTADITRYETYYRAIEESTKYTASSEYYSVSAEMTSLDDGSYRYYVIIDEPKISMYDIVIMTVEDNRTFAETTKMMPSSGVFDASSSMIPNQINSRAGFVKGLIISGECDKDQIFLKLLVEWKDRSLKNITREFIGFNLTMNGIEQPQTEAPAEEGGQ